MSTSFNPNIDGKYVGLSTPIPLGPDGTPSIKWERAAKKEARAAAEQRDPELQENQEQQEQLRARVQAKWVAHQAAQRNNL